MEERKRVLVVDRILEAEKYQQALQDFYDATSVTSGRRALGMVDQNSADAVLIASQMDDMGSVEVLRTIRSRKRYKPVFVMGDYYLEFHYKGEFTLKGALEKEGATGIHLKTEGMNVLVNMLQRVLDLRILFLMQHPDIPNLLKRTFDGKYVFDVTYLSDEAREKVAASELVISGIGNPGWPSDGLGFVREVRQQYPNKKIIVMSGYGDGLTRESLAAGADAYIPVPDNIYSIADKIEEIIKK